VSSSLAAPEEDGDAIPSNPEVEVEAPPPPAPAPAGNWLASFFRPQGSSNPILDKGAAEVVSPPSTSDSSESAGLSLELLGRFEAWLGPARAVNLVQQAQTRWVDKIEINDNRNG
jgi:hypothetical protein